MLYLAICWGLFLAGFKFGQLRKSYRKLPPLSQMEMNKRLAQDVQRYQRLITLFALAGILAAILFSIEMLFVVNIDMTNLLDVRTSFGERDVTLLSQAATVLGAGGFLSLVAAIVGWGQLSRGRRALWLVSPLLLSTLSLFSAGRQTILQLTLIAFFSLLLRGGSTGVRVSRFKMPIVFAGIVMVALAYGMIVSSLRSGESVTGNKGALLSRGFLAQMDTNLETALDDQPAVIRDGSAELLFYLTHPIPNFVIFFDLPRPGPYWGLWEFPFVARRLQSVGLDPSSVGARIDMVYAMFATSGRSPQVWQTGVRDLIIDFGDAGALVATALFGFWAGRIHYRTCSRGGLISIYLLVGINLLCVYSALLSGISDTLVFFYFMAVIIMYFRYEFGAKETTPRLVVPNSHRTPMWR